MAAISRGRVSVRRQPRPCGPIRAIPPEDLAAGYDVTAGSRSQDPVSTTRPVELCPPELRRGADGLRIAIAGGFFARSERSSRQMKPLTVVARALGVRRVIELPEVARARAAAYLITASEGGLHHLPDLRTQADKFDPNTRSRFLAGAVVPAAWVNFAQRFRSWYRERTARSIPASRRDPAPATPCPAIRIGQSTIT